jgi:flagellar hook-associated protein 2
LTGSSTNAGIQFVTGGSATQSSTTPYTVNITQAAQQAVITAPNALAASTVIDNTNNTFSVSLNGLTSDTLTLAAGTYTQTQLAQAVQSAINGDTALDGDTVNVNVNNTNNLTITSSNYGSQATLGVLNGTALATLGFTGAANATGTDVAGSFTVNGNTEPATGSGQFLTGNTGNANTAGLELNVSLTSAQVGAGIQAPVTVSNGIAAQLSNLLSALSNPATGRFQQVDAAYKTSLTELNNEITAQNNYIQQRTTQLQNQFANMEQVLAGLQNASREISSLASDLGLSSSSSSSSSGSGSSSSSGSSSTSGSSTTG